MFFWKFTRSGKISNKYISLIMDFHYSSIDDNSLLVSYEECEKMLILIHDVETLNGKYNYSAGILKQPFQQQVNRLGFRATNKYQESRYDNGLVYGQMTLGTHGGSPLDYGLFRDSSIRNIKLDINNLKIVMTIDAKTGHIYGNEDKLIAYRQFQEFFNYGYYFDLMPMHSCIVEIVSKMMAFDKNRTLNFIDSKLRWEKIYG
jgi:hypothetical protein